MAISIQELHSNGMSKLRQLLNKKVRITYSDNSSCIVPCTISDNSIDMLKYSEYTGKEYKVFNILIEDLQSQGGKTTDFMYVEWDRVKYQVQTKIVNGVYSNMISLISIVYRGNVNE